MCDVEGSKDVNTDICRKKALKRLQKWDDVNVCVYTDGSALDCVRFGGAGVVITRGDAADPVKIEERMRVGGAITSS